MSASLSMITAMCRELKLPTVAKEAGRLADEAQRQGLPPLEYLYRLLEAEVEERRLRRSARCIKEGGFPLVKTLAGFDFTRNPDLPEARVRRLMDGDYIPAAETVLLIGDPGTGKTHLATALGVAAAGQGRSVRFVGTGRLVNELVEARDALALGRVMARYARVDLLVVDELGYVPLRKSDAELLFQVLSDRTEQRAIVITTNLPFSEWTSVFPDPRLCRAVIDRLTHRAHIIETGKRSIRYQDAVTRHGGKEEPREAP
jgi:DNA replication protein DnaC